VGGLGLGWRIFSRLHFVQGSYNGGAYNEGACTTQLGSSELKDNLEQPCISLDDCSVNQCGCNEQSYNIEHQNLVSQLKVHTPCEIVEQAARVQTSALSQGSAQTGIDQEIDQFKTCDTMIGNCCNCRKHCNSTSSKKRKKTVAIQQQTSSQCLCYSPFDAYSEGQHIIATNPAELTPLCCPMDQDSYQQRAFADSSRHKLTQNWESQPCRWVTDSETQPVNPKRNWQALTQKLLSLKCNGSLYHGESTGWSKGHNGSEDKCMLQGNLCKIHFNSKKQTADNCGEVGVHNYCLTKDGSIAAETDTIPRQPLLNGFSAETDFEQLATAYLDLEDGQDEGKERLDVLAHPFSTHTINYAKISTPVSPKWGSKRHYKILAETEGFKRNKKSLPLQLVARESGRELACGTFVSSTELNHMRSTVTSTCCTVYSTTDLSCFDSMSTIEEGIAVHDNSKDLKEDDLTPTTVPDCLCTGHTFLMQRTESKVNLDLLLSSRPFALPISCEFDQPIL
jgi:hypothetical protein